MKTDYDNIDYLKYEKTEIDLVNVPGATRGFIAGLDPEVGITIVNAKDHTEYVYCLSGPMSPRGRKIIEDGHHTAEECYQRFDLIFEMIVNGTYDNGAFHFNPSPIGPDITVCSFAA